MITLFVLWFYAGAEYLERMVGSPRLIVLIGQVKLHTNVDKRVAFLEVEPHVVLSDFYRHVLTVVDLSPRSLELDVIHSHLLFLLKCDLPPDIGALGILAVPILDFLANQLSQDGLSGLLKGVVFSPDHEHRVPHSAVELVHAYAEQKGHV